MPLEISAHSKAGEVVSPLATATDEVQKRGDGSGDSELADLRTYLSAQNKGGVLAIRTRSDGTKEMYRMQWYHRLWFCRSGAEQQKAAQNYVIGLLSKIKIPHSPEKVGNGLGDYLSLSESITYEKTAEVFKEAARLAGLGEPSTAPPTSVSHANLSEEKDSIDSLLESQKFSRGDQIGNGAQGRIYSITYQNNQNDYLYKEETSPHLIIDPTDLVSGHKFYRISGDIAAARCKLSNTVESVGFFLKIVKNPKAVEDSFATPDEEYYYLPNTNPNQIKADAKRLITQYPNAEIFICGQIMKRAPGETLSSLMQQETVSSDPQGKPFKNIVYGIYSFLAAARPKNFVHRDIKPSNLMFDQKTGRLSVIDMTSARHLARRDKAIERESASDRSTMISSRGSSLSFLRGTMTQRDGVLFRSTVPTLNSSEVIQDRGNEIDSRVSEMKPSNRSTIGGMEGTTLAFAHPSALAEMETTPSGPQEKQYGAEFDCFSTAMTLLSLINKDDFIKYQTSKFPKRKHEVASAAQLAKDWGTNPKKYLEKYLSWVGGDQSETFKILTANPNLKRCLELFFEASAPGEAGEEAFAQLATNRYMQECGRASQEARAAAIA